MFRSVDVPWLWRQVMTTDLMRMTLNNAQIRFRNLLAWHSTVEWVKAQTSFCTTGKFLLKLHKIWADYIPNTDTQQCAKQELYLYLEFLLKRKFTCEKLWRCHNVVPWGRRNQTRPLKTLLDAWDRNRSTGGPTPWWLHDDDDDDDDECRTAFHELQKLVGRGT